MLSLPELIQEQLASFGETLRKIRLERGLTLDQLGEMSGLSKSYLSRLESGDRQVSIAAAMTLAAIFEVSVASFFEAPEREPCVIVRAGDPTAQSAKGLTYWPLSHPSTEFKIQPLRVVVSADREGGEHQRHDGEEWLYVLSGKLTLSLDGACHDLDPGDAAHFDARMPHRLVARGGNPAEVLLAAAPRADAPGIRTLSLPRATFSAKPRVQLR